MSGWFAVKRGISAHPIFRRHPERLAIWMWLLDNAAWKDTPHDIKGKTIVVKRGQVCASERRIAEDVGVGYQVVRTFISRLKTEHMVNAEVTHGRNVITICNYEKYQSVPAPGNATPNATLTHDQRTKEQGNKITTEDGPKGPLSSGDDDLPKTPAIDEIAEAVSAYNASAAQVGWPVVRVLSKERRAALKARLHEAGGIEGWHEALRRARASPLLCGQNDRGWIASFDFLTQRKSFTRLMEGNYDARSDAGRMARGPHAAAGQQQAGILGAFARREAARGG